MSANSSTPAKPVDLAAGPSQTARGVISYLIFIHFFFLFVGIKSNTSSSGLDQDLRNKVPGLKPYLQLLAMDLSYMFHLTYYDGMLNFEDTDYFIEVDVPRPDGTTEHVVVAPDRAVPPIRSMRFGRLARVAAIAAGSGNDNMVSLLPTAVAGRMMLEEQASNLTFRVRRRVLQNLMLPEDDPRAAAERNRDPDGPASFQTVYEARVFRTDDGEINVAELKAASDMAAPQGTPPRAASPEPAAPPAATAPDSSSTPTTPNPANPFATGPFLPGIAPPSASQPGGTP